MDQYTNLSGQTSLTALRLRDGRTAWRVCWRSRMYSKGRVREEFYPYTKRSGETHAGANVRDVSLGKIWG